MPFSASLAYQVQTANIRNWRSMYRLSGLLQRNRYVRAFLALVRLPDCHRVELAIVDTNYQ